MENERKNRVMLGRNGLVRFSYAKVFEPEAMNEGDKPKYSVSVLIPKSDKATLKAVQAGINAAISDGKARFGEKFSVRLGSDKYPLKDGDEKENEEYQGHYYINAKSTRKPAIIDRKKQPIIDDDDAFYSGCFGRVSIEFFPYNHAQGGKGISAGLGNIMKVQDGDRLGGGYVSADDDFKEFEAFEDEDEDEDEDDNDGLFNNDDDGDDLPY